MPYILRFRACAGRAEYWLLQLTAMAVALGVAVMSAEAGKAVLGMALLVMLASGYVQLASAVRRCRAAAIHPAWVVTFLVPLVAMIAMVVVGVLPNRRVASKSE